MKLARIILPERDNDNYMLTRTHDRLRRRLVEDYDGCTYYKARGAWKKCDQNMIFYYHEDVFIYDVAMERADVQSFRQLAREIARDARQECVMIVTPQGDVEFMKPTPIDDNQKVD